MNNVGQALQRKLGPLPVWVWAIAGGILVYWYRNRQANQGATLQPSQANATPPQAQTTLQPGESVYDPNTGALSTAPGGDSVNGGTGGSDYAQGIQDLANAIVQGINAQETANQKPPVNGGNSNASPNTTKAANPHKARPKVGTHVGKHGAIVAPYGAKKPKAPKGFHAIGTGHGGWLFVPGGKRQKGHPKSQHKSKVTGRAKSAYGRLTKPRSGASTRTTTGGRTTAKHGASIPLTGAHPKPRTKNTPIAKPAPRQRQAHAVIRPSAPMQHAAPTAHTPVTAPRQPAHASNPPRPSSPPPRTTRRPAPPPPKRRGR